MTDYRSRIIGLEYVSTKDLRANPANFRRHPQAQSDALKGVLEQVGIAGALLAYKDSAGRLTLIDGHLRKDAAPQEWPVLVLDVTDDEAALLLATTDPIAAMAQSDAAALDSLLRNVSTDSAAVQQMLAELAEGAGLYPDKPDVQDVEPQIDRAEELRQKWGVQAGDLWQLGDHRLICGDCTDPATVAKVMGGDKPKIMVTDPPYGVEYDADWRNDAAEKGLIAYAARRVGKVENDDRADWTAAWKLFPGDVVYCWHADRRASTVEQNLDAAGFEIRCQIVWVKPNAPISRGHYRWGHEACWYAVRKGESADWIGDHVQTTAWQGPTDANADGGHSTQKPVWLMGRSIANHAGDVYEPFLGSGTTLIACEQLGRKCRAVEISPAYVGVALERWATATGRTPERIG